MDDPHLDEYNVQERWVHRCGGELLLRGGMLAVLQVGPSVGRLKPTKQHALARQAAVSQFSSPVPSCYLPHIELPPGCASSSRSVDAFVGRCRELANVTRGNDIMLTIGSDFQFANAHLQ